MDGSSPHAAVGSKDGVDAKPTPQGVRGLFDDDDEEDEQHAALPPQLEDALPPERSSLKDKALVVTQPPVDGEADVPKGKAAA